MVICLSIYQQEELIKKKTKSIINSVTCISINIPPATLNTN